MCLYTSWKVPITAVDDIVCYKMCLKTGRNSYVAPYMQNYKYILGQLQTEPDFPNESESVLSHGTKKFNKVNLGFHSFRNKYDAIRFIWGFKDRVVLKCIIPKGSKYYIGDYYKTDDVYCSNNIIIGVDEKPVNPTLLEKIGFAFVDMYQTFIKFFFHEHYEDNA